MTHFQRTSPLRWTGIATAILCCASLAGAAPGSGRASVSSVDREFAIKSAQGGATEIALGRIVQTNASSSGVKAFGQQMLTDHTKSNKQLSQLAQSAGLDLDWTPSAKQRAAIVRLGRMHGRAFDTAYRNYMVKDHQEDISDFRKEARNGTSRAFRSFAQNTLPVLQHHLQMAKTMTSSSGVYAHHTMGGSRMSGSH